MKYNLEHIEKYLEGQMEEEELKAFEKAIENDPELRHEVSEFELIKEGFDTLDLKQKMAKIISSKSQKDKPLPYLKIIIIFLGILGLVILGNWLLRTKKLEGKSVYAQYFRIDPGIPTPMSSANNIELLDAIVDYKAEQYEESLDKLSSMDPKNDTIQYYLAMNYRALGRQDSAKIILELLPESSAFNERRNWYLLGYYLQKEEYDKARDLLPSINDERTGFHEIKNFLSNK